MYVIIELYFYRKKLSTEKRRFMAKYKCSVCGFIYDEEAEGKRITELSECPVCKQPMDKFV